MVRLAKFNEEDFIEAAIAIAAACGMAAVSISAIASKVGAPVGSVYHRFDSRSVILARAWLRVKADFRRIVASQWTAEESRQVTTTTHFLDWCRNKPAYAKFLLQCEDYPLMNEGLPEELYQQLETEQAALDTCFARCTEALINENDPDIIEPALRFLLIDSLLAAVKPYLMQNLPIPLALDAILDAAHSSVHQLIRPGE